MTALCDICQRPVITDRISQLCMASSLVCTCDCRDRHAWGLRCEIKRLRELVRSAYDEGWTDYYELDDREKNWEMSETKKELEKLP